MPLQLSASDAGATAEECLRGYWNSSNTLAAYRRDLEDYFGYFDRIRIEVSPGARWPARR